MPTLTVNGQEVTVEDGATVLQACEAAGAEIPRFCYHERLSIAGNCRMCLVEMEKAPKPIASCAMPAGDGMVIHTDTEYVKKAREGVMEFLLINHPLDCPICDQGGECDLQDQSVAYGTGESRYQENKRAVNDKDIGPLISTTMTRCIHCMRCVRFSTEVAGFQEMGSIWRGEHTEVTTYLEGLLDSEMSGNVIDLCPVGALTSKPYAFTARSWELKKVETVDVMDAVGSNIRLDTRGNEVMRVLPVLNEEINEEWISDKTRFHYDGLKKRRLDRPYVRKSGKLQAVEWGDAFLAMQKALKGVKGDQIAAVVGPMADMESMFALKGLLNSMGSEKIESRLCGAEIDTKVRASYLFNTTIEGIEQADYCLIIGANPRLEATLVNSRLRKAVVENGLAVANVGPELDLTFSVNELGDDPKVLESILSGDHDAAKALKKAKKPMLILGEGALRHKSGKAILAHARDIADTYGLIADGWNGFNVLHSAASQVGALDLGLTVEGNMAALRDDAANIKVFFNLGEDDTDLSAFNKSFKIYIGSHGDAGAASADVVLPGSAYSEKSGTYINMEGRVQRSAKAVFAPGAAREDWSIFRAFSEVIGNALPYNDLNELRKHMADVCPHVMTLDVAPTAEWNKFGRKAKIAGEALSVGGDNYYRSNPIARASKILADCENARNGIIEEATGTNG